MTMTWWIAPGGSTCWPGGGLAAVADETAPVATENDNAMHVTAASANKRRTEPPKVRRSDFKRVEQPTGGASSPPLGIESIASGHESSATPVSGRDRRHRIGR